jgi:cell division septation protein DedD
MKRIFLIISPYFLFCLIFSIPFTIRPSKHKIKDVDSTSVQVDSNKVTVTQEEIPQDDTIVIDSLSNLESSLEIQLDQRNDELNLLKEDSKFKLIVGSFKSELKAQQLSDRLLSEGYETMFIEQNDIIRVSAGFSYTRDGLLQTKNTLESKGYKTWILKNS